MDARSERNLAGVHPDLQAVIRHAKPRHRIVVTEGIRTAERQSQLLAEGKSKTHNSRHLTGHAVDIAVFDESGTITWDFKYYAEVAEDIKRTAKELGIPVKWGGEWSGFKDGTHFQLTWDAYPIGKPKTVRNSKTIATAGVGIPLVTLLPEMVNVKHNVDSLMGQHGGEIMQWVQIALIVGMALYIVWERKKKIDQEGV